MAEPPVFHTQLIGQLCKLTELGVELEKEYEKQFGIGNWCQAQMLFYIMRNNKLFLMFIDDLPIIRYGCVWYWVKEVGKEGRCDLHLYTLNQLMVCKEN